MKRLSVILVIGLFFSGLCFAQVQTGNASYNASKSGLTLAHASLSFGTKVKITNLMNNKEETATVTRRIPPNNPRIADISKDAGDAIGMSPTGYTMVRLEVIPLQASSVAPVTPAPVPEPPAVTQESPPPAQPPSPAPQVTRIETIQRISPAQPQSQPQYFMVPTPAQVQDCRSSPLCLAILILLIIAVLLLVTILILMLCMHRIPWSPWYYPVWVRRHLRYLKNRVL
jgi:rare lipoprotein A (peptidoglycan hydrolase)